MLNIGFRCGHLGLFSGHQRLADEKTRLARPDFFAQQGIRRGDAKGLGVKVGAFQAFVLGTHTVDANRQVWRNHRLSDLKAPTCRNQGLVLIRSAFNDKTCLPMLIRFNKPYGVLSQFTPEGRWTGLIDHIDLPGVYVAGRLDADSEGLLLLTDDGQQQARIADPRFKMEKTYLVQVEGVVDDQALTALCRGVMLNDGPTLPARARAVQPPADLWPRNPPIRERKNIPTSWLELVIREGRNRQVRRMTAAVGLPTLRLIRTAVGPYNLDGLPSGTWQQV